MIPKLVAMIVRALFEVALIFLAVGLIFCVAGWRLSRRLVTSSPDRLEKLSGPMMMLASLAHTFNANRVQSNPTPEEEE